ncbi:DUF3224 domain-containing protein [Chondromyces crocatus]|uniref:DUF3224 domain-containing protein n=1 Tax=Chondromyces crocatus TaxID=52 RepID=A0A0K1ESD8_CHOCO|nr:DUF3224 domain-containing protein [Chondromyces crocatus]AKT43850.1 uncharacterized protein CMC5_080870 [Chondromyces crocatus]
MSDHASATYEIRSWDETPLHPVEGLPKIARVNATTRFSGEIEGEGTLEYLMTYRDDGVATFVGLERVVGRVGGKSGSFVLRHLGTFEDGVAKATLLVVQGSATGELRGLMGEGGFAASGSRVPLTLDYVIEG